MYKYVVEDGFSKIRKTGIGQYTIMVENILSKLGLETITISKDYLEKIKNRTIRRIVYSILSNGIHQFLSMLTEYRIEVFITSYSNLVKMFYLSKVFKKSNMMSNIIIEDAFQKIHSLLEVYILCVN